MNRTSFYSHFCSPGDLAIHALSELSDVVGNADIVMRSRRSVSGTGGQPAGAAGHRRLRGRAPGLVRAAARPRCRTTDELVGALIQYLPGWPLGG